MTSGAIASRLRAGRGFSCRYLASRAALLVVVGSRVLLGPLAEASPPDPTWVAGVWDDGDFDDVVGQITALASTADALGTPAPQRPAPCGAVVVDLVGATPLLWRSPVQDRAPPLL
jgi:hypothetical protein